MRNNIVKEQAREDAEHEQAAAFFFGGGAGFEGGVDGARAVGFSFLGMLDCAIEYAKYCNAELTAQLRDCKLKEQQMQAGAEQLLERNAELTAQLAAAHVALRDLLLVVDFLDRIHANTAARSCPCKRCTARKLLIEAEALEIPETVI